MVIPGLTEGHKAMAQDAKVEAQGFNYKGVRFLLLSVSKYHFVIKI